MYAVPCLFRWQTPMARRNAQNRGFTCWSYTRAMRCTVAFFTSIKKQPPQPAIETVILCSVLQCLQRYTSPWWHSNVNHAFGSVEAEATACKGSFTVNCPWPTGKGWLLSITLCQYCCGCQRSAVVHFGMPCDPVSAWSMPIKLSAVHCIGCTMPLTFPPGISHCPQGTIRATMFQQLEAVAPIACCEPIVTLLAYRCSNNRWAPSKLFPQQTTLSFSSNFAWRSHFIVYFV